MMVWYMIYIVLHQMASPFFHVFDREGSPIMIGKGVRIHQTMKQFRFIQYILVLMWLYVSKIQPQSKLFWAIYTVLFAVDRQDLLPLYLPVSR